MEIARLSEELNKLKLVEPSADAEEPTTTTSIESRLSDVADDTLNNLKEGLASLRLANSELAKKIISLTDEKEALESNFTTLSQNLKDLEAEHEALILQNQQVYLQLNLVERESLTKGSEKQALEKQIANNYVEIEFLKEQLSRKTPSWGPLGNTSNSELEGELRESQTLNKMLQEKYQKLERKLLEEREDFKIRLARLKEVAIDQAPRDIRRESQISIQSSNSSHVSLALSVLVLIWRRHQDFSHLLGLKNGM